jgi:hypothetical protein
MPGFHKSSPSLRFHHQNLYVPLLSLIRATCPAHPIIFILVTRIISVEKYRSLRDHLQSFFFLYCLQLPSIILHVVCKKSGVILSPLTRISHPGRIWRKENILEYWPIFFLIVLVFYILEVPLVKTVLCLFSKNNSAYQINNYDTNGNCGMDWKDWKCSQSFRRSILREKESLGDLTVQKTPPRWILEQQGTSMGTRYVRLRTRSSGGGGAVVSTIMNCVNSIKYLENLSCYKLVNRVGYNSGHRRTV